MKMVEFKVGDTVEIKSTGANGTTGCVVVAMSDPDIVDDPDLRTFTGTTPDGRVVGAYCDQVLRVVKSSEQQSYTKPMASNKIVGYVVKNNNGEYIAESKLTPSGNREYNVIVTARPTPVSKGDAYRRLAAFVDLCEHIGSDLPSDEQFYVAPVFHEPTPLERASEELGGLLVGLCSRHGLDLGLTREQIEKQIAKELKELGAGGSSFVATGIPSISR